MLEPWFVFALATSIFALLVGHAAATQPYTSRQQYGLEAYIIPITCNGTVPDGAYGTARNRIGLPKYQSGQYNHLEDLCSAYSTKEAHFEGYCIAYYKAKIDQPASLVWGLDLAEKTGLYDDATFAACRAECRCPTPRDSLWSFRLSKALRKYESTSTLQLTHGRLPGFVEGDDEPNEVQRHFLPGRRPGRTGEPVAGLERVGEGSCPVRCTPDFRCASSGANGASSSSSQTSKERGGCYCKAVPIGYKKQRFVALGCAAQASRAIHRMGGFGKRHAPSLDVCPCNASYVSAGCCGAGEGLVWEPPEARLGSVIVSDLELKS